MDNIKSRLNKYLTEHFEVSRREADRLIQEGKVYVNHQLASLGQKVSNKDKVTVNGRARIDHVYEYYLVNKPEGYLSSTKDPKGTDFVTDLVNSKTRLYPVGRLDKDSQGLVLLTNDGDLAYKLTHPKYQIQKVYLVEVFGEVTENKLNRIRTGVMLEGKKTNPALVEFLGRRKDSKLLKITLTEGRNREIRKICSLLKLEVIKLKRVSLGNLSLGDLGLSQSRKLSKKEISNLKRLVE